MLAEIFLLRMEAIYRVSEESAPTGNSRFVPIRCRVLLHACCGRRSRVGISRTLIDRFAQRVLPHSLLRRLAHRAARKSTARRAPSFFPPSHGGARAASGELTERKP